MQKLNARPSILDVMMLMSKAMPAILAEVEALKAKNATLEEEVAALKDEIECADTIIAAYKNGKVIRVSAHGYEMSTK